MKIEIRNFAGNWESLTCDCGGDEFVAFQEYEKDGETITDFECVRCHEGPHFVGSDGWREAMNPMAQGGNWSIENRDEKAFR